MRSLQELRDRGSFLFPFQHYKMDNPCGNLFVPYHWHDEIEILYCLEGQVTLLVSGISYDMKKGSLFFINSKELHQIISTDPSMSYYAYVFPLENLQFSAPDHCQTRYLKPLLEKALLFPTQLASNHACYHDICREMETIIRVNEEKSCAYQLVTKASLLKIISCLAQNRLFRDAPSGLPNSLSDSDLTMRNIMDWLEQHYQEKVTLEWISDSFHMSPKYFSRYFKKHFQTTFSEYLNHIRIENACILLLSTDRAVADIALFCGFENTSYFIRKFRELTGKTPLSYRTLYAK
ncbi:MAG: AraC family transcriptional regulator [Eubacteriales bacterium]|nr:AraC family transcriptional regulator [Eubacteriales bacterium]